MCDKQSLLCITSFVMCSGTWLFQRACDSPAGRASIQETRTDTATSTRHVTAWPLSLVTAVLLTNGRKIQFLDRDLSNISLSNAIDFYFLIQARGFESWLGTIAWWPRASYLHLCASVTKQYNLVPANRGDLFGWESNRAPGGK